METRLRVKAFSLSLALSLLLASGPGVAQKGSTARRTPIVEAVERVGPAVVNISAERLVRARQTPFDLFFGDSPHSSRNVSLGSGVVLDASGVVVTNDHVISGASRIWVTTADGKEYDAEVLGADADNDLAVLKVKANGLRSVRLAPTSDLMIGEPVIAIGNPFGLSNTVTTGILSAVRRTVPGEQGRVYTDFLQTDAAINPGNSGGALVNVDGDLIGINTAIVGGANTIGFAIPSDRVRKIANDLLRFGEVKVSWLGLRGTTVGTGRGRPSQRPQGFEVTTIWPDSPAASAGLAVGDVVVAVNGRPVDTREDFETALAAVSPGRKLAVVVRRGDGERTVTVTAARPPSDLGLQVMKRDVGIEVGAARRGLVVTGVIPRSPADRKGIEPGDLVLAVNGQKAGSEADLSRAVESGWGRSGLVLVIGRGGTAYTLTFPLP